MKFVKGLSKSDKDDCRGLDNDFKQCKVSRLNRAQHRSEGREIPINGLRIVWKCVLRSKQHCSLALGLTFWQVEALLDHLVLDLVNIHSSADIGSDGLVVVQGFATRVEQALGIFEARAFPFTPSSFQATSLRRVWRASKAFLHLFLFFVDELHPICKRMSALSAK